MRNHTYLYLAIGVLIGVLVGTACQPSRRPVPQEELEQQVATVSAPQEAQTTEPASGETPAETEPPASGSGIPADIPIPDSVYEMQVSRKGSFVQFKVDGEIADMISFYQQNFPELGWEEGRAPDISLEQMGTMLRQKENGDRVAINMQKNALGGFVFVTITVSRAQ
jgi:hypothetical protein